MALNKNSTDTFEASQVSVSPSTLAELRKRKRERRIALLIAVCFVLSTIIQAFITGRRQAYGFVQSLLYFGLVHLNVILIMFLVFLASRNLVKAYLLRKTGKLGSSLRWKMVTSLLAFSLLPSILLFAGSSYVIRQGFDRWFGGQVSKALEDAQAITDVHYGGIESNLDFFSKRSQEYFSLLSHGPSLADIESLLHQYPVQGYEIYYDLTAAPLRGLQKEVPEWAVPRAAVESLTRAFAGESFHLIRQFGDGDLVQQFVPIRLRVSANSHRDGALLPGQPLERTVVLVLSHTVPLGLKTRIADLRSAFAGYSRTVIFKDSLKANYTLILTTLFVLILFVVSWFGLFIAKSVTEPVSELMKATEAFKEGQWTYRIPLLSETDPSRLPGFGADLEVLKASFNSMAEEVGMRGRQLEEANGQLISLVRELEDRERYLEILLSSIRRGVLVLDPQGRIQRINSEALEFASKTSSGSEALAQVVGQDWRNIFGNFGASDDARSWLEEAKSMRGRSVDRIFEANTGEGKSAQIRSLRATGIGLIDEESQPIGWLIIIEDVSDAARLERLAAWQEVARRVAHEIKNPLTPIQISADRLQRRMGARMDEDLSDGPVFRECVGQIQKQVRVIRDLVREFSQFAKLPEPQFRTVNLPDLVDRILGDYRFTHPNCVFRFENRVPVSPQEILVRADAEYMRRLIVNLADNALQSLEESKNPSPEFRVTISIADEREQFVSVAFDDNGPGIPANLREKIFDPYVTSKASGLGLGLPIVRRIAIEHQGRIRCEDAPGGRFVLELPILTPKDKVPNDEIPTHS